MLLSSDFDECNDSLLNDCHLNASCYDTVGSYSCECNIGFSGNGTSCAGNNLSVITIYIAIIFISTHLDVDECRTNTSDCDDNALCVNNIGSYECHCNSGFIGNGFNCSGNHLSYSIHNYVMLSTYRS